MSTIEEIDHLVIGAGAIGSATAMELARRGARVVALDRFGVPNAHGSSHGLTRMVRMAYFEHPDYVPLLRAAYAGWRQVEADTGRRLLHLPGIVYTGTPDGEIVGGSRDAAQRHGIPHETLDLDALRRRYPMLHTPADHVGLFEPEAGYVLCEASVSAMMESALRHGADLRAQTVVESVGAGDDVVMVRTHDGALHAKHVVVTAGAWTASLLPGLQWPLTVTRQVLAWVWPRRPELFTVDPLAPDRVASTGKPRTLPCWGVESETGGLHYGFPIATDGSTGLGLKFALHARGDETDPDRVDRTIRDADIEGLRGFLRRVIPDADGPIVDARVCLYTNTPDGHFAIGRHPACDRILVASPCSGHGFKFAPAIGRALAEIALDGETSLPVDFLDAKRFETRT